MNGLDLAAYDLLPEDDRIKANYKFGRLLGISPERLVCVLAIASQETGNRTYRVKEASARAIRPDLDCPRLIVGFESRGFMREADLADPFLRDYVTGKTSRNGRVWVDQYVAGKGMTWKTGAPFNTEGAYSPDTQHFFETVLAAKSVRGLGFFSIGLTQQFLIYSRMYADAFPDSGIHYRNGWPGSWNALWRLYFGSERMGAGALERPATYLGDFPGPAGSTNESIEFQVTGTKQYGNTTTQGARDYYYGTGSYAKGGGVRGRAQRVRQLVKGL